MGIHTTTIDTEELKSLMNEVIAITERITDILEKLEDISSKIDADGNSIKNSYIEDDSVFFEEIRINIEQSHEKDDYKEIFVLEESLKEAGVPYVLDHVEDGYILTYPSPEYPICTVIECKNTIGSDIDMLEVTGLLQEDEMEEGRAVFLLADNVFNRIMEDFEIREIFDNGVEVEANEYFDNEYIPDNEETRFETNADWFNLNTDE